MTRVYVSGIGQHDNVGDTVLRRSLIDALRGSADLHVLVGSLSPDYVAGLELQPSDIVYTSESAWHKSLVTSSLKRRTWLVLSAGEAIADLHSAPDRLRYFFEGVILRLRGGGSIQTGVGIRRPVGRWRLPLVSSLWPARLVTWRDEASRRIAGFGTVTPDWAYAVGTRIEQFREDGDRPYIAVTLRNDRPYPNDAWRATMMTFAQNSGLRLIVVTQVKSDADSCRRLAADLDAELLEWKTDNLQIQESEVRSVLSRSRSMVSDRVHGLIIGLTEGAMPIAFSPTVPEKAVRTLSAIGLDDISLIEDELSVDAGAAWMSEMLLRTPEAHDKLANSRRRLDELTTNLRRAIAAGRTERHRPAETRSAGRRYITVLHSMSGPKEGEPTRYANHMLEGAPAQVTTRFFGWRYALTGDYDVFHVHWPEYLLRGSSRPVRIVKQLAFIVLMLRLKVKRIPIVRTAHNLDSHESGGATERALVKWNYKRTAAVVKLNTTTPVGAEKTSATILHGHYRDRFAEHPLPQPLSGRFLYFGLIRPYKGVLKLIEAFLHITDAEATLRIVGKPSDETLRDAVLERASQDDRVSCLLAFVSDKDLVQEIGEAELVVLPYEEMHNSGALLVALSMDRPVLVPRSPANEAIAAEVGESWVNMYDGELRASTLATALAAVRTNAAGDRPQLHQRDWRTVGMRHYELYLRVIDQSRERTRVDT
jgi:beta-1,4-mannosyltransferase